MTDLIKLLGISGLIFDLVGVILLFRYGMPYRVSNPEGTSSLLLEGNDPDIVITDSHYTMLGTFGLVLIIAGTGLQCFAILGIGP